ncbi:MAG: hypothetical protein U0228_33415 [Myxococcaceae bacterium]
MLSLIAVLLTATPQKVASPAWNVVNVSPELAAFSAEQLADALRRQGLTVTTAADIATLLGAERQRQLLGCDTQSATCMAELANALGCDATLTVSLAKLGDEFRGVAKMMSSRDSTVLASVRLEAKSEKELTDQLDRVAAELAKPLGGTGLAVAKVTSAPTTRFVAPLFWWVPGTVGLLSAAAGVLFFNFAGDKFTALTDLNKRTEFGVANGWVTEGTNFQTAGWVFSSVGVAGLAGSLVWLLVGGHTETVQASVMPTASGAVATVGGSF